MATLQPAAGRGAVAHPSGREGERARARLRLAVPRVPRMALLALALMSVAGLGLLQVLQSSHLAELGYQIRELEHERGELAAEVRLLEAEVAVRSNLDLLYSEAVDRLGMITPEETMRVSVRVAAPAMAPVPRRYVPAVEPMPDAPPGRWERLTSWLPGFH